MASKHWTGVGTGFPGPLHLPVEHPSLTLLDINPNSLALAADRLRRSQPAMLRADVTTAAQPATAPFESISMSYLLQCLLGTMAEKGSAFAYLVHWLAPGGVVFGITILGEEVPHNLLARRLLSAYNQHGIFGNATDSLDDLPDLLRAQGRSASVRVVGSVAFFVGRA